MKRYIPWHLFLLLAVLAFSVQSCFWSGNSSSGNFKTTTTKSGKQIGVNQASQAVFKGKIYFTINRDLYVLDGTRTVTQLTHGIDVRDPAVSPDGKWIAFIERYYDYSNLAIMPANGGAIRVLLSGNGHFFTVGTPPNTFTHNDYNWFAQPSWSPDSKSLIFLSDLQKNYFWANYTYGDLGNDFDQSPFLDMQVFTIPINNPPSKDAVMNYGIVAYADYGDGGDRDPSYRPGHSNQIIYTHYTYDAKTKTQQVVQLYMENPTTIANNPSMHYHPGDPGGSFDPSIAITPPSTAVTNIEPSFSPNGNFIAYIRNIDPTHMGMYVMPVPSSNITTDPNNPAMQKTALVPYQKSSLIASGEFVSQPVWSPDGKQIAYLAYTNNTFDIWLANVSLNTKTGAYTMQGSPIQLTSTNGGLDADSRPFWTA